MEITPVDQLRGHCKRRYRHCATLCKVMLDQVEKLLRGERALFLERPDCRDLAEEVLYFFSHFKVPLICRLEA